MLTKRVAKRISGYMSNHGFKKKNTHFFRIENDLAFCLELNKPGGLLYVTFCVIPLYIPSNVRYYTYGNRLNNSTFHRLPVLQSGCTDEDLEDWVRHLFTLLDQDIFPFFHRISSPDALLDYLDEEMSLIRPFFFCSDLDLERLRLFTCAHLCRSDRIPDLAEGFRAVLKTDTLFSPALIQGFEAESRILEALSSLPEEEIRRHFRQITADTLSACFR